MLTFDVTSNAGQVLALLQHAEANLPRAEIQAADAASKAVLIATTEAMERLIYEQPLPESYYRYGLTDRTGALLAAESREKVGPAEWVIKTDEGAYFGKQPSQYSEWRHWYPDIPAPWREIGLETALPDLDPIATEAVMEIIGYGLFR